MRGPKNLFEGNYGHSDCPNVKLSKTKNTKCLIKCEKGQPQNSRQRKGKEIKGNALNVLLSFSNCKNKYKSDKNI